MLSYRTQEFIENSDETGIWVDFSEQTWIFIIKDDVWVEEEIATFKSRPIKLSFFQKGIVDGFLIEIQDMLEVSDTPFCLLEANRGFLNTLKDQQQYKLLFILADKDNRIIARKEGHLSLEMSVGIKRALREQKMNCYDIKGFNMALTKLQKRYEPYELSAFVLAGESVKGNNLK